MGPALIQLAAEPHEDISPAFFSCYSPVLGTHMSCSNVRLQQKGNRKSVAGQRKAVDVSAALREHTTVVLEEVIKESQASEQLQEMASSLRFPGSQALHASRLRPRFAQEPLYVSSAQWSTGQQRSLSRSEARSTCLNLGIRAAVVTKSDAIVCKTTAFKQCET